MAEAVFPTNTQNDPSPAELVAARAHLNVHALDGLLLEDVPLARIAAVVGTPTWVYGAQTIRSRLRALTSALADTGLDVDVHYAVKANDHLAILALLAQEGTGADIVSEGELLKARHAGVPARRIVFSGVGKSLDALRLAIAEEIAQINVESAEELEMLSALAVNLGRTARIALRVNPDVDAGTHAKISTGRAKDKFGVPYRDAATIYALAARMPGLKPVGLATHIGSQILNLAPFRDAYTRVADLVRDLRASGETVHSIDCGGGLGIPYRNEATPSPAGLAAAIKGAFHNLDVHISVEPGRWLVGPAGVLLTSVILVKQAPGTRFVVLDAAMNDLIRPAMYDAWHGVVPVAATDMTGPLSSADIVGPVCETSDTFARNRLLPDIAPQALMAILDAGAYGRVMSSAYNARPFAAEVLVDGSRWSLVRNRQLHSALWAEERLPSDMP